MTKKLTIPLAVLLSAIILSVAMVTFLAPLQIAKGGEAACIKLQEAKARLVEQNPEHPGLEGVNKAIAENCPVVGAGCGAEFGLGDSPSQCYSNTESCTADGNELCVEPAVTCPAAQPVCGINLP